MNKMFLEKDAILRARYAKESSESEREADEPEEEDEQELTRELEAQMADMPYEMLLKADRKANKVEKKESLRDLQKNQGRAHDRQSQPGTPKERSMREKPRRDKQVFQSNKQQSIDPRFVGGPMDDFQREKYYENYSFISELKEHENRLLKKELRRKEYRRPEQQETKAAFQAAIGKNKGDIKVQRQQLRRLKIKAAVKNELRMSEGGLNRKLLKLRLQERLRENGQQKKKFRR